MRCNIAIALILALLQPLGGVARITRAAYSQSPRADNSKPNIELTLRVTDHFSCAGSRDAYTEIFNVVTRYVNRGTQGLIIYTGEDYGSVEKVAKTLADMRMEKYEVVYNDDVFFTDATGEHLIGAHPRSEPAKFLQPGQATESQSGIYIVMRKKGTNVPTSLLPGTYYVRLGVMTKIADAAPSSEMNSDPAAKESFHWTFVLSEPIRVELSENPILKNCDEVPRATHP